MLLDHFHPPLNEIRGWEGFHYSWAVELADCLNEQLVPPWHAEPHVRFGLEVEIAGLHREIPEPLDEFAPPQCYQPGPAQMTVPLPVLTDAVEVRVSRLEGGREIVAAMELVSPANKDRPNSRDAFTGKCESLLSEGVGLVIVDIVTQRRGNLHLGLMKRLGGLHSESAAELYATSYHPIERNSQFSLDVWYEPLQVGGDLPVLPLFLRDGPCLKVDLPETYRRVCERSRIHRDLKILASSRQHTEQ